MSARVLFVDDDEHALAAYQRVLRKAYDVHLARGGAEALRALDDHGPFAAVVSDMRMPGMDGVALLQRARERAPESSRVMLTGADDQRTAADAVNKGAIFRFLTKPCSLDALAEAVEAAVQHHRVVVAERELLEKTLAGSIRVLADILAAVDGESFGRTHAVREVAHALAAAMRVRTTWELDVAAMLSGIGCATVPPSVLVKARAGSTLAGAEQDMIARLPRAGADLLANIPRLERVARIVLYQASLFDGGGPPGDGTAGEDLPIESRLLRVASDLVAAEARGVPRHKAVARIAEREAGTYDPRVVAAAASLAPPRGPQDARSLRVEDLRAGMILAADVVTADAKVLIARGHRLTSALVERLRNYKQSVGIIEPVSIHD